ncbi:hypothetical protein LPB140_08980 [Sphingorhabdus lutea]|uniref:ABM domain-containing protein n=1 Tax=Sphingorhabdus lutea TaxID=1913578 RepID=A0A1L3JCT5_9SPHN|nr:antibiotic biosynthesis monooxygenase [Sphingorhabdus lutea]APG62899.1 hypothetical protein LPB140_08980 [Sphingorhabdus lutea]
MNRRDMMAFIAATIAMTGTGAISGPVFALNRRDDMEEIFPEYGLMGQIIATPGNRAALIDILKEGTKDMPGNMGYALGEDLENEDALWVIEFWQNKDYHGASLKLPSVQEAIAKGRPLIASFGQRTEFKPV